MADDLVEALREHVADAVALQLVAQARIDGYTETIFGRRRPFPDLASPNRVLRENAERAALNAPIQGSAADIMKLGLLHIHDQLVTDGLRSRVLLQIHDELVVEVEKFGIGMAAPEITGMDLDGVAFKLSDYRGKVVFLDFWGDW